MVKRYIFQFLLLATALTGCQHEADIIESLPVSERFEATIEAFDVDTKTGLSGSGERQYAVWTKNDAISVFQGRSVADRYILLCYLLQNTRNLFYTTINLFYR